MDTIKAANKIIREGIALLPDDAKKEFKAKASDIFEDEAINNACGAINGNAEKEAMLAAYAVQEANRMASTLWRLQLITEDLEKEYRALPAMDEIVKPILASDIPNIVHLVARTGPNGYNQRCCRASCK